MPDVATANRERRHFVVLPATEASVPATRRLLRTLAADWQLDGCIDLDDVALCLSELVTNAVKFGDDTIAVDYAYDGTSIVIRVTDPAPGAPVRREPDVLAVNGRGLAIVEALSDDWGITPQPPGKSVWFRFDGSR